MAFKDEYIEHLKSFMLKLHPKWDEERLTGAIEHIYKANLKDPSIIMDNNVTGDGATITTTKLCSWIDKAEPVVSGNATFYCQPTKLQSPTSIMLKTLKLERKAVKKRMFAMDPKSDEYSAADLEQGNKKVIMNADYGGSGTPTAAFYTLYSPPATTLMAQSIITTMAAFFESYLGDNQLFFSIEECCDWMQKVIQKDQDIPSWFVVPSKSDVSKRIIRKFKMISSESIDIINRFVDHCSEKELVYLYYANNFKDLIRNHPKVQSLLKEILEKLPNYEAQEKLPDEYKDKFESVKDYNKWVSEQMFLNPYEPPETIKEPLTKFIDYMNQFVYVEYLTPDSIVKLNNHKRNTVLLVDTDSNIINANLFVSMVLNDVFPGETFGRSKLYSEMILVNTICAALSVSVANILDYYGRTHHIDSEARKELTMKNEFLFRILFLLDKKKRYCASIVLREGNMMVPFKPEIKGVDFIKAGVTEDVSSAFEDMLCNRILFSDKLELYELMSDLKKFERGIYDDLKNGGKKYLKSSIYKPESGYKSEADAWKLQVFKGSMVWNELYPEQKIYSLDRVHILKLAVSSVNDLDKIKDTYPNEYKKCIEKIYNNENSNIKKTGLSVICIPNGAKTIPKWLIPLIDYDLIISNTISSFKSILRSLNIEDIPFKSSAGDASLTSCLISL